jgi:hypothetical protein
MHWSSRRDFVKNASITLAAHRAHWFQGATPAQPIDLKECVLVTSQNPAPRELKALAVLSEECYKRSGLTWKVQSPGKSTAPVTIYIGLASGLGKVGPRTQSVESTPETYAIHAGNDGSGHWITVAGSDEHGVLFGVGRLLRLIHPYVQRPWPPVPQEFDIPPAATSGGELTLSSTREQGQGGSGRGCQVSEVWLINTTH